MTEYENMEMGLYCLFSGVTKLVDVRCIGEYKSFFLHPKCLDGSGWTVSTHSAKVTRMRIPSHGGVRIRYQPSP